MKRLAVLFLAVAFLMGADSPLATATVPDSLPPSGNLPGRTGKASLDPEHFPSRIHAFVWRNWGLVPAERLALVLQTSVRNVRRTAADMGLKRRPETDPVWLTSKGYITVLRRNWHLLPYGQILQLLDLTQEELEWRLYEDDFLFVKLGRIKPECEPLFWEKPSRRMRRDCRAIASVANSHRARKLVPRFDFFRDLPSFPASGNVSADGSGPLRIAFSYCAEYGDPLMDPDQGSYSEKLLRQLASQGINAIWVHSVLRMLVAPEGIFPGDGNWQERRRNLQILVDRAAKYGIRVMLYVNEPRALPERWFDTDERERLAGVGEHGLRALCTSDPSVLKWLTRSFESLFSSVQGLGGAFIISMSENLTNCASHNHPEQCPRCAVRPVHEILADVNNAIAEGVCSGNPDARVLVWDWKWKEAYAEETIRRLDKRCTLMSVSEWDLPIERGGIASTVSEYSISSVGPGPKAVRNWEIAREAGLGTAAKVMVNATWELGSFPVIPAVDLVAAHARNLAERGVEDAMMTWSLGGYPSVNFAVFQKILSSGHVEVGVDTVLERLAKEYYGERSGPAVRIAWKVFSEGFKEYPYHIGTLYNGPQHMGPANLFRLNPTGWSATMVGFPYDDLNKWRSIYPAEVYIAQNRKVADAFEEGASLLDEALAGETDPVVRQLLRTDAGRAHGIKCHFRSIVNQAEFILKRDAEDKEGMIEVVENEVNNINEFIPLCDADPTFGYESSNHYYYVRNDLLEKLVNLEWILRRLASDAGK